MYPVAEHTVELLYKVCNELKHLSSLDNNEKQMIDDYLKISIKIISAKYRIKKTTIKKLRSGEKAPEE